MWVYRRAPARVSEIVAKNISLLSVGLYFSSSPSNLQSVGLSRYLFVLLRAHVASAEPGRANRCMLTSSRAARVELLLSHRVRERGREGREILQGFPVQHLRENPAEKPWELPEIINQRRTPGSHTGL